MNDFKENLHQREDFLLHRQMDVLHEKASVLSEMLRTAE